ncbi:MAG: transcription-repair coupling factor [Phycisphaeraceae bacterium]|nr:transcription-repair coupling factor [Phycisphaerales bacterium]MCB9843475.1 transcription-repair coupling factor [Phycisphaeraceae bacterium]
MRALAERVRGGRDLSVIGASGSSTTMVVAAIHALVERPMVLVVAHLDDADHALDELAGLGVESVRVAALEYVPGESRLSLDLAAERLSVLAAMANGRRPGVVVCPIHALMQAAPRPEVLGMLTRRLEPGSVAGGQEGLVRWMGDAGFRRVEAVEEPGDFAVRGGIIDIFPAGAMAAAGGADASASSHPIRLDFFGDEVESVHEIDVDSMASDRRLASVDIVGPSAANPAHERDCVPLMAYLAPGSIVILAETPEIIEQGRGYYERVPSGVGVVGPPTVMKGLREGSHAFVEINQLTSTLTSEPLHLPVLPLPDFARDITEAIAELGEMAASRATLVACQNQGEMDRLHELLEPIAKGHRPSVAIRFVHRGFLWGDDDDPDRAAIVPYHELVHRFHARRRTNTGVRARSASDAFLGFSPGDLVVHAEHGIGRFVGLNTIATRTPKRTATQRAEALLEGKSADDTTPAEYLTLEFAGRSKLHVPVTQVDLVQRYIGSGKTAPKLSTLGGKRWRSQKDQVRESVRDLAAEMLRIQAAREHMPGIRFPNDTPWQREFEAEFPYQETDDQLAALGEIKRDMSESQPMDRLLCGDVGFGKTELAIRAAFKAAEFGKQAAILVPTTLLAEQHERTFKGRFADYPFTVESLSRFKTAKEQNDILKRVRLGQVDILIGTHRLLSKDVKFADLGLVVIDEEQRFGVEHKQSLLRLRMTADVLTLSATPIPRTLHMAMLGLRDISSLATPPVDRRAVVTEVVPYNKKRIEAAIRREMARDGQIFFVHNRVHNIKSVADDLHRLVPEARIVIGHGQMPDGELEDVMRMFVRREADILVATTIIESGIDIPSANTMFIDNADHFGLAELHQLRGRVGRYKHRAYCYLLLPDDRQVNDVARKRLKAIEEFSMLGAGFRIATRDLEIRGSGNLLGAEQSGHIAVVGYDMYCRLLEQAARELRNEPTAEPSQTTIDIGATGGVPKVYIPSDARRLEAYRRVATARTPEELAAVGEALRQAYGEMPRATATLIELAQLRLAAYALRVRSISVHEQDVVIRAEEPSMIESALKGANGSVRTLPSRGMDEPHEVFFRPPPQFMEPGTLLTVLRRRFADAAYSSG